MAELKGNKKRLTINLSFFTPNDHHQTIKNDTNTPSAKPSASTKSPKNFEEPNGVVGLGIVAALNNEMDQTHDPILSSKSSRNAIFAVSPRSSPIPIFSKGKEERLNSQEIEMSEEYTCVIKHIGKNVIKKRVYFDGELGSGPKRVFCAASPPVVMGKVFHSEDFLSYCYLCKKKLHGLDIFMYRGEKAFCSAECRYKQMSVDEHKEKCGLGVMKPLEYSVSPCSGPMQFLAGVAAA